MSRDLIDGERHDSEIGASPPLEPAKLNLRRLERIQRVLQFVAGLGLLIFVVLIVLSYFQLQRVRSRIADGRQTLAKQEETIKENAQLIERQKEELNKKQRGNDLLQEAIRAATRENPRQGEETKQTIESSIPQDVTAKQIPPRIYIQIARDDQRRRAADAARQLQSKGFIVPGIENVGPKAPKNSEVRYCHSDEIAQKDLGEITTTLKSLRGPGFNLSEPQFLRNCRNVRPRHYEIWFGEDF